MLSFEVSIVNSKFSGLNSISCYLLVTYTPKLMWYTAHPKKQVSRAGTSKYIPQYPWNIITWPCPWYQPLAHQSPIIHPVHVLLCLVIFPVDCFFFSFWVTSQAPKPLQKCVVPVTKQFCANISQDSMKGWWYMIYIYIWLICLVWRLMCQ